jgi:excisionase family DNA binding protein
MVRSMSTDNPPGITNTGAGISFSPVDPETALKDTQATNADILHLPGPAARRISRGALIPGTRVLTSSQPGDLLKIGDLARLLGLSEAQIRKLVRGDEIPHLRMGHRTLRFRPESIDAWLREVESGEREVTP